MIQKKIYKLNTKKINYKKKVYKNKKAKTRKARKSYKASKIIGKTKTKKNKCAPFIQPIEVSSITKSNKLLKTNIKMITSATDESCFTIKSLRKIATKWNDTHPTMKIDFNTITTGKTLWNSINNVMKGKCNTEVCWLKQEFIKNSYLSNELLKNFKPFMPKSWDENPREWLNTIDIRDVMNQYEIKYPKFEFIGPVPMDFDTKIGFGECVVDELCKIDLDDLINNKHKTKIGVIFNLDKHTQSGSHWVAMNCDTDKGEICYWDSYGINPNKEVVILMNKLKEQGLKLNKNLEIKINKMRHQYKNSECGMYCIYFITSLLDGKTFENVVKTIVNDDAMNYKRITFFNKL